MSFGFAVSNFIAVVSLIDKTDRCLRDVGESASEYQKITNELSHLQIALSRPEELNQHAEAIPKVQEFNILLKDCRETLEEWLNANTKFEKRLGRGHTSSSAKELQGSALVRRVQWRFGERLQVRDTRLKLASYTRTIELLLAVKYQDMTAGLSAQIESSGSDTISELRIQRSDFDIAANRTARSLAAEFRLAVDPLLSNMEAIR
ncbi:hypothetical protein MMC17_001150 [Xylographa soralifera]|nr:hypothetical protein [Xylographa soralifera]